MICIRIILAIASSPPFLILFHFAIGVTPESGFQQLAIGKVQKLLRIAQSDLVEIPFLIFLGHRTHRRTDGHILCFTSSRLKMISRNFHFHLNFCDSSLQRTLQYRLSFISLVSVTVYKSIDEFVASSDFRIFLTSVRE